MSLKIIIVLLCFFTVVLSSKKHTKERQSKHRPDSSSSENTRNAEISHGPSQIQPPLGYGSKKKTSLKHGHEHRRFLNQPDPRATTIQFTITIAPWSRPRLEFGSNKCTRRNKCYRQHQNHSKYRPRPKNKPHGKIKDLPTVRPPLEFGYENRTRLNNDHNLRQYFPPRHKMTQYANINGPPRFQPPFRSGPKKRTRLNVGYNPRQHYYGHKPAMSHGSSMLPLIPYFGPRTHIKLNEGYRVNHPYYPRPYRIRPRLRPSQSFGSRTRGIKMRPFKNKRRPPPPPKPPKIKPPIRPRHKFGSSKGKLNGKSRPKLFPMASIVHGPDILEPPLLHGDN